MKNLKYAAILILAFGALPLFNSCVRVYSPQSTGQTSSDFYNPSAATLHPEFTVFHKDDEQSDLNIKLYPNEMKFVQAGDKQPLMSRIRIHYEMYSSYTNTQIQDSATIYLKLSKTKGNAPLASFIHVKIKKGTSCILAVEVLDMYSKHSAINIMGVKKMDDYSRQNYTASYMNHQTIFDSNVSADDTIFVEYKNPNLQKMFVSYYKRRFPLSLPPHIVAETDSLLYKPDTTSVRPYTQSLEARQPQVGYYLYRCDTTVKEGFGLATFYKNFPFTKKPYELVDPLQYITTKKEFQKLKTQTNIKETLDSFWLKFGGTPDKSRELIRIYYNRVLYANLYFSAHTEGWRTDRGMIYLIYGPPYSVSRTDKQEVWNYSENRNSSSASFTFNKVDNPLTENYYVLKRMAQYQSSWQDAVMSWRSGVAYSLSNR